MSGAESDDRTDNDDLFGDDDEVQSVGDRRLSDQDLDSGDDEDCDDRAPDRMDGLEQEADPVEREARVLEASIPRHAVPKPSDGQIHTLRIPNFVSVQPVAFDKETFTPPTANHRSTTNSVFSAHATATTTMRYRKNAETGELESNTLLHRWSDGSVTLSIGGNDYELTAKPLTSTMSKDGKGYQDHLDSYQYAATPYMSSQLMQIVGHLTNQFDISANQEIDMIAAEKLQNDLAVATRGRNVNDIKDGLALIQSDQDPELQKREAEQAERERNKLLRRREAAAARADQQPGARIRASGNLGMSDDLDGGRRVGGSRKRIAPSGPRRARRRADYDSEEEEEMRGGTREDEYDLEDDFLVGSDEEPEVEEEDEESEEESEEEESEKEERPKHKKQRTQEAKPETKAEVGSDVDAEGEDDDVPAPVASEPAPGGENVGRARKRNVIEDDEDE